VFQSNSEIQVVVFDVDDTLYPERQFVRSGYHAVADVLRKKLARDDPFEDWLWGRFLDGKTAGAFDDLNEQFQLGLDAAAIVQLVERYRFHVPAIAPFEGVLALLQRLRETYRLGLLTDGPAQMQQNKIEALGVSKYFDERLVVLTDELGADCGKPDPAGFERIAEEANVPHAGCVYIGDNPAKDFVAPNALGWRTIQYRRDDQVHAHKPVAPGGEAGFTVTSDEELVHCLE
jgi:putative hydrolase of the HAD superfamily